MQNVVFVPSSPEIRTQLHALGLELYSVRINNNPYLMVVTNQLGLMADIANKFNIDKLYSSDAKRNVFMLTREGKALMPTRLGTMKKTEDQTPGTFFLVVYEGNKNYYYTTH